MEGYPILVNEMKSKSKKSLLIMEKEIVHLEDLPFAVGENRPKNNPKKPHNRSLFAVTGPMTYE
jgi:hypothetical protein